jgi:hypothetical protein
VNTTFNLSQKPDPLHSRFGSGIRGKIMGVI